MNQRAKKYSEVEGNIKHNNFMSSKVCVALPRMSRFLTVLLLSATLSVCWRSVVAKTSCSEENDEWRCTSGECIPKAYMCNGTKQCRDGSDETEKLCKDMECSDASFRCSYGACISLKLVCDGVVDCVDKSDEDSGSCLKRRNDLPDDGIDDETRRKNCADWGQMKCWSGQCVRISDKCNGIRDCADGSDERSSLCKTMLCNKQQFQCGYGACIPKQAKCNGTQECWDGTDELEKLCKKKVNSTLTPTTKLNLSIVTESIVNPSIIVYDFKASENLKNTTTQTTTNHVQIENKEFKTTNNIEKPLYKGNETKSTPKTSSRHPIATTSAENFGMDLNEIASTNLMKPTTEANKIKKYAEDDLQITTPKIKVTTKLPTLITNGSFKIDISRYPSSKQAPNFETNLNSSIDNSLVSNSSDQIPLISRPSTEIVPPIVKHPGSLTGISELEINTSKVETTARPQTVGTITPDTIILPPTTIPTKHQQPTPNQYNTTKPTTTLPPTTITTKRQQTVFSTNKPIKECVLRNCDHPLFCKISFPGPRNSEITIVNKGRLSLIVGSQVIFNCAEGYDLEGANRLTCTPTGWSHSSPSCISYCDADFIYNCRPPLKCLFEQSNSRSKIFITKEFTQRVREHSHISFACDKGYLHEGPTMRKCTARGWSNEIPRCINYCDISELEPLNSPLKCKVFDSNIQRLKDYQYSVWNKKIKERSYFEFTCEDGYKLDGENRSTCMNNGWSSAAPTCIRSCDLSLVSPCTAPLLCHHNHKRSFINLRNWADVVLPGVHVDYSCEDGYELDGTKVITCTNDGWSNRIPTCKETVCDVSIFADCTYPLKCKIYDRTLRKYKSIYRRDIPELSNNENLYVNCEDGYTLQGSQYLACRGRK
uniref:Low-density lipoprotein receptor-related protein n=1 Tax=Zeugodacus cucurbitae TaxID=28588 RepID=A0A0A1WE96_ZEUCU